MITMALSIIMLLLSFLGIKKVLRRLTFVNPTFPLIQSVLCATGCLWNVILSSSFTNMFRERSSWFQLYFNCVSLNAGGMSSSMSNRGGLAKSCASSLGITGL